MIDLKKRLSLLVGLSLATLFGSAQVLLNGGYGIDIADSSPLPFHTIIDGKTVEVPLKYYDNPTKTKESFASVCAVCGKNIRKNSPFAAEKQL